MTSKSISGDQKKIIEEILTREFISSEESDMEDERHVMVIKPLPWRGEKASRVLNRLDNKLKKQQTKQSTIQTVPRVIGEPSSKPKPTSFSHDFWGFVSQ